MKSLVTDDMKLLLTSRDAAAVCGCTPRVWRIWNDLGFTPIPIKIGSRLFWKHRELADWIEAGCPKREAWAGREKKSK